MRRRTPALSPSLATPLARAALRQVCLALDPRATARPAGFSLRARDPVRYCKARRDRIRHGGGSSSLNLSLFANLLTTQVAGVHACAVPKRRACAEPTRAASAEPCSAGRVVRSLVLGTLSKGIMRLTDGSLPLRAQPQSRPDHTGVPRPSAWSSSGPTGSTAVHAGPSSSSYTTHLRQVPLAERRCPGAPARRQASESGQVTVL